MELSEVLAYISDLSKKVSSLEAMLDDATRFDPDENVQSDWTRRHAMSGIERIAAERERQIAAEGWTPEHDDEHTNGSLATAAACYAMAQQLYVKRQTAAGHHFVDPWPWDARWDKRKAHGANFVNSIPTDGPERLRMLEKAGALIAAEIDRLLRLG